MLRGSIFICFRNLTGCFDMPEINSQDLFMCAAVISVCEHVERKSVSSLCCVPFRGQHPFKSAFQDQINQIETARLFHSKGSITCPTKYRITLPKHERHKWFITCSCQYHKVPSYLQGEGNRGCAVYQIWMWSYKPRAHIGKDICLHSSYSVSSAPDQRQKTNQTTLIVLLYVCLSLFYSLHLY